MNDSERRRKRAFRTDKTKDIVTPLHRLQSIRGTMQYMKDLYGTEDELPGGTLGIRTFFSVSFFLPYFYPWNIIITKSGM